MELGGAVLNLLDLSKVSTTRRIVDDRIIILFGAYGGCFVAPSSRHFGFDKCAHVSIANPSRPNILFDVICPSPLLIASCMSFRSVPL